MRLRTADATPEIWCPLRESDPRPLPYQGSALPLSQKGKCTQRSANQRTNRTHPDRTNLGAGDGNRTRVISLEGWGSTIELLPHRDIPALTVISQALVRALAFMRSDNRSDFAGGEGWIRTSVLVRGQIYSLLPLTTRPPLRRTAEYSMNRPAADHPGATVTSIQNHAYPRNPLRHRNEPSPRI